MRKELFLEALFSSATEAIIVTDAGGNIVMANPRSHELFGYEPDTLTDRTIEDLVPQRFRVTHAMQRESYNEHPGKRMMGTGRELYACRKDGSEFPTEISLSYFREGESLYAISFIIDITRRKESENALRQAKMELERYAAALKNSNMELEQFAYVASHDLQEPLRKIQAFGDRLLTKEANTISPESRDYLDRMLNAAGRMKTLIIDLLTFSRVTTQAKPFQKINLDAIMREVLSDLEVATEKAGAKVEVQRLPEIEADPLQMRQLFQNLLSNALKFQREGLQPVIRVSFDYKDESRQCILLRVEDNGIGFDVKYLDRIFNIFQRLEGRNFEGSGVGLAICRKIALRHGGDITAESAPGKGATFIVTLPVQQSFKL